MFVSLIHKHGHIVVFMESSQSHASIIEGLLIIQTKKKNTIYNLTYICDSLNSLGDR